MAELYFNELTQRVHRRVQAGGVGGGVTGYADQPATDAEHDAFIEARNAEAAALTDYTRWQDERRSEPLPPTAQEAAAIAAGQIPAMPASVAPSASSSVMSPFVGSAASAPFVPLTHLGVPWQLVPPAPPAAGHVQKTPAFDAFIEARNDEAKVRGAPLGPDGTPLTPLGLGGMRNAQADSQIKK